MSERLQPSESNPDDLAELLSKSLPRLSTPSYIPKPAKATFRFVREIGTELQPPLKQPVALASAADGGLLVLDRPQRGRFRLLGLQPDLEPAGVVCELAKGSADAEVMEPVSLAVDGDGRLFVVDAQEGCVKKFSPAGRWLDTFRSAGPTGKLFDYPLDAAVDEAGNLVVADANNNRIVQLSPDGELGWVLENFPLPGATEAEEFNEPCSLCLGRGPILRVADRNESRVLGFDRQHKLVALWQGVSFPSVVRMAPDGTSVLVADRQRIQRFAASGNVTGSIEFPLDLGEAGTAGGGGPMAVDAQGNVLVVDLARDSILILDFAEG